MCKLSKKEKAVLDDLLTAVPSVVCLRHRISPNRLANIKTRVRRKEAKAKKLLKTLKKYKDILHPPRKYKGV